jgi:FkbM family methyltransferase
MNAPLWPADYNVAPDHCRDVLVDGCYDVPFNPTTPPVILDLGANVGAFTRWASTRWPGCTIHAFEPHPGNFYLLTRTAALAIGSTVTCYQLAVAANAGKMMLDEGQFNCGEWSLLTRNGKSQVEVSVVLATSLPKADILKIDTEGCEAEIVASLLKAGRLPEFSAIMLECHSAKWVASFKARLAEAGFTLTGENIHGEHRREMKWVRSNLLPSASPST